MIKEKKFGLQFLLFLLWAGIVTSLIVFYFSHFWAESYEGNFKTYGFFFVFLLLYSLFFLAFGKNSYKHSYAVSIFFGLLIGFVSSVLAETAGLFYRLSEAINHNQPFFLGDYTIQQEILWQIDFIIGDAIFRGGWLFGITTGALNKLFYDVSMFRSSVANFPRD